MNPASMHRPSTTPAHVSIALGIPICAPQPGRSLSRPAVHPSLEMWHAPRALHKQARRVKSTSRETYASKKD